MNDLVLRSPWPGRINHALFERVVMTALALAAFAPYFVVSSITLAWPARSLGGPVDALIPFDPRWELVYASIYIYIFVAVAWVRDATVFRRTVLAFCLVQFCCYAIFLALPVTIARPTPLAVDGRFVEWALALNYSLDHPRNLFPSLHLGNAFLVALLIWRVRPRVGLWVLVWATLIGYSTIAARHHYFADVVAGIAVALVADRLIIRPAVVNARGRELLMPDRYALAVAAVYPLFAMLLYLLWRAGWRPFE